MSKIVFSTAERRYIFAFFMVHLAFFVFFCRFSACIACILLFSVHSVYNMDIQACITYSRCVYRYQKGINFALVVSVRCVRVGYSSRAQCTKNVHPLVLSVFFIFVFFSKTADRMQNRESARNKKKKKSALTQLSKMLQTNHQRTLAACVTHSYHLHTIT